MIEAATNILLWQILYSLMGIMMLGTLFASAIFAYRKLERAISKQQREDPVFTPEKRAIATCKRSMLIAKYKLNKLRVKHITQPEELFGWHKYINDENDFQIKFA